METQTSIISVRAATSEDIPTIQKVFSISGVSPVRLEGSLTVKARVPKDEMGMLRQNIAGMNAQAGIPVMEILES